jgi:O-antigen/teichoic acid export membrane protein
MKKVAREYVRFPKYSTFEALTNTASVQLPIILIASLTTGAEVGLLILAMRIMQAPMGLIGSSISQVYFSRAVEEHRNGRLGEFTARVIGQLAKVGVGPLVFAGIVSPTLFGFIFGPQWGRAGELVAWMTPWFVLQFLVSPVSMSLHVTNNQRNALVLQVAGLLLRVLMVLAAGSVLSGQFVPEVFAISGFLFYFLYLVVVCRVANVTFAHIIAVFKNTVPFTIAWVVLAIIVLEIF